MKFRPGARIRVGKSFLDPEYTKTMVAKGLLPKAALAQSKAVWAAGGRGVVVHHRHWMGPHVTFGKVTMMVVYDAIDGWEWDPTD